MSAIFDAAQSPKNVLIVVLDYAKDKHLCLICNGAGDELLKAFAVHNDRAGFQHLLERIETTCKRHGIKRGNVIVGGEDNPAYAENFLHALDEHEKGGLVVRVNAWKAKKQRENIQASTDRLDLLGIAKTLINRDAYLVFDREGPHAEEYANHGDLRELSRTRDALVKARTSISNRIHNEVKVLFAGFLDSSEKNPIGPFTKASLALMGKPDFHAGSFARKRPASLAKTLAKLGMHEPALKAAALIARAQEALPPRPESVNSRQQCLQRLVSSYRHFQTLCNELEELSAKVLARSPAAVLSSISGIGIVTAAGIAGEQGHVDHLGPLRHMASYAGIVPGIQQTGGPDNPGVTTRVKRRCNRRLKKHLVHAVFHMGTRIGPPEFICAYQKLKAAGQHADFIMARRLLHTAKAMMRNRYIYLPPELRGSNLAQSELLLDYLREAWPKLLAKWSRAKAVPEAFAEDAPLGIWRRNIRELAGIELPLNSAPPYMCEDHTFSQQSDESPDPMK